MSDSSTQPVEGLPRWLLWIGSLALIFHFTALGIHALAAPSGPWPNDDNGIVSPPLAAARLDSFFADYLKPIRLTHNYHLLANRTPGMPGVYLEFRLKDEEGHEIGTVKLPDENASCWVRHRQSLLTQYVVWEDWPIRPPQSEVIAAPNQEVPKVQYWEMVGKGQLQLLTVDINHIPKDRPVPVQGPKDWSLLTARAFARHLCREHGAAKVQVLRHHQEAIRPIVLTEQRAQARDFDEVVSDFGEFSK
jgi:hypothetical protein